MGDDRKPCASCGRKDLPLKACGKCEADLCSECVKLHENVDCPATQSKRSRKPRTGGLK